MRIAITVDPYIPFRRCTYGGIERTVDFVCEDWSSEATT
jgi:hypothetical protein